MKVVSTRQGGLSAAGEANLQSVVDKAMAKEKSSAEVKKNVCLCLLFSPLSRSHLTCSLFLELARATKRAAGRTAVGLHVFGVGELGAKRKMRAS